MSTSLVQPDHVDEVTPWLEGATAEDALYFAADRYTPRIGFATGFGPEGLVLIDLIARHRLPIRIFTIDTGLLFPETYALWRRLEERYGIEIEGVRSVLSLDHQAGLHGARLWERDPDTCCALRKLEPLRSALSGLDAWVAAIRRDQTADRAHAGVLEWDRRFGLLKVNPLASWSQRQVWEYLWANNIPFNPLHVQGYPSIGCAPCTSPVAPGEDPRAGRWRERSKTECGLHLRQPTTAPSAEAVVPSRGPAPAASPSEETPASGTERRGHDPIPGADGRESGSCPRFSRADEGKVS